MRKYYCLLILTVLWQGCWSVPWLAGPLHAAEHTVEISNFAFNPAALTIDVGDTVTWINKDGTQHTSTSGANGIPDGQWNSQLLALNQAFPHTFATPGQHPYYCIPHPFMTGTITVREAPGPVITIRITSPTNQTSFPSPGNVTIEAAVEATGASVTNVTFFAGRTVLGQDDTAPYSITVPLEAGSHSLSAQAATSTGASVASEVVLVTVGPGAPSGSKIENPIAERIPKGDTTIELAVVAEGLISPLGLAAPDDGSGRLFIYDQAGLVHLIAQDTLAPSPLLDVRERLVPLGDYDERGLLGLATHPDFAQNPLLYTYTSEPVSGPADFTTVLPEGATNHHQSVIAEWRLDLANSNRVEVASRRELLRIDQPQANHNGGTMRFGPDGFLYVSLGDGGDADDQGEGHVPGGNGQERENIYGKVIRLDVDGRSSTNGQYAVPADNPFVGQPGVDEIYAYGMRNPYSFSFDRMTGELYLADVGQNQVEEINRVFRGGNYGWPIKEGSFYFDPAGTNAGFVTTQPVRDVPADLVDPIAQYDHDDGAAAVGGFVYRGTRLPGLLGRYVMGDWGNFDQPAGRLFYLDLGGLKELRIGWNDRALGLWLKGYGQDAEGELYVCGSTNLGPSGTSGKVLKLVPPPALELTAPMAEGTNVMLGWNGGAGPFIVQAQADLAEESWTTVSYPTTGTASFPADEAAAFYRVAPATGNPAVPFTVYMTGASERPNPVETSALGTGTLSLEGNTLHFDVHYSSLSGAALAAHIHGAAPPSGAAGVLIDLAPYNSGAFGTNGVLSGAVTLNPEQKAMLLAGLTYMNIHTPAQGGGEIRGQIVPLAFAAQLSGEAERPTPVDTTGGGHGLFFLNGNELTFHVGYQGLSGAAMAAHIHGPATSKEAVGVLIDLQPYVLGGFGTNGTIAGKITLTAEQLAHFTEGRTYINIHTSAHGGGEVRGQIIAQPTALPGSTILSAAAERPEPFNEPGTGTGLFILEGNRLHFQVSYSGLTGDATAAHIHGPAPASAPAGVLIDLVPYAVGSLSSNGTFSGSVVLTDVQRTWFAEGLTYVNVHTSVHRGGEIRGQISRTLLHSQLLGASERPASVHTTGKGTGHFLLIGNQLTVHASFNALSSPAGAAHIHGVARSGEAAGILVELNSFLEGRDGNSGSLSGTSTLSPEALAALVDGLTYLNVHTERHPGGEIRGQIVR